MPVAKAIVVRKSAVRKGVPVRVRPGPPIRICIATETTGAVEHVCISMLSNRLSIWRCIEDRSHSTMQTMLNNEVSDRL